MSVTEIKDYLNEVRSHLHLDRATERRVIGELYSYFQERIGELKGSGFSDKDAAREAIKSFGRARMVARMMYEAHSKGSWFDVSVTALPHLLVAGLFFFQAWSTVAIAGPVFALIAGMSAFGWFHGRPNWSYSWVGYSLLPFVIGAYVSVPALKSFFLDNDRQQGIVAIVLLAALLALSLWLIVRTTVQVVKRDWIMTSLMLVPLPILGGWLFNVTYAGGISQNEAGLAHQWDAPMAAVLLVLSLASAIFIRLRQRVLKTIALLTLGVLAGAIAGYVLWGDTGVLGLLAVSLVLLLFLLSPALLEARLGHDEMETGAVVPGAEAGHSSATR